MRDDPLDVLFYVEAGGHMRARVGAQMPSQRGGGRRSGSWVSALDSSILDDEAMEEIIDG